MLVHLISVFWQKNSLPVARFMIATTRKYRLRLKARTCSPYVCLNPPQFVLIRILLILTVIEHTQIFLKQIIERDDILSLAQMDLFSEPAGVIT